jgi:hypothetical protein
MLQHNNMFKGWIQLAVWNAEEEEEEYNLQSTAYNYLLHAGWFLSAKLELCA